MHGSDAQAAVKADRIPGGLHLGRIRVARWWALLLVVPLLMVSVSAEAQRRPRPNRVVVGAKALPSVRASVKRIDLRHAPRQPRWRRGDGIRYIPKRVHVSPKYQAHLERVKPRPAGDDPLLQIQRDFPQWRSFDAPDLNQDGVEFTGATPPDPVLACIVPARVRIESPLVSIFPKLPGFRSAYVISSSGG